MKDIVAAKRYAEAFFDLAKETIGAKKSFEELSSIAHLIKTDGKFRRFLENSKISDSEKCAVMEEAFKENISAQTKQLLKLLVNKRRIEEIEYVADYTEILYYRENGMEKASLNIARPLSEEMIKEIKNCLEKKFLKKLELEIHIEPELIAGIKARIGNTVIDGSVKKKLSELKENLMGTRID